MAKKNFDRLLNMDTAKVLEEVHAGNPGLAARMVSEKVVDSPVDAPFPLKLVPSVQRADEPTRDEAEVEEQSTSSEHVEPEQTTTSAPTSRLGTPIQGRRGIVTRASGKEVARLFCYVEPDLYREVRMYCAQHDVSISDLVNGVLIDALRRKIAAR